MRARVCITCDGKRFPRCHESRDDPSKKTQKKPYGSFEIKCCGSEHDVNRVSEKSLVKVSSQTMVAFAVPDNRFYSRPLLEQLVLPGFHIGGV